MELPRHPGGPVTLPGREEEKHHAGDATAPWRNGWAPIQQIPAGLNGFDTTQYRMHLETAFHLISFAAAVTAVVICTSKLSMGCSANPHVL